MLASTISNCYCFHFHINDQKKHLVDLFIVKRRCVLSYLLSGNSCRLNSILNNDKRKEHVHIERSDLICSECYQKMLCNRNKNKLQISIFCTIPKLEPADNCNAHHIHKNENNYHFSTIGS